MDGNRELYRLRHKICNPGLPATSVALSSDGNLLAVSSSDGVIRVYATDSACLICTLSGHSRGILDIQFSPTDCDVLASALDDRSVRLWLISSRSCFRVLNKHTFHVSAVRFTARGNLLVSASADENICIWDAPSGRTLKTLAAHSDPVLSICISFDDTIIVSGSYDGLMRIFDLETGHCLKTLTYNTTSHGTATASTRDALNFPILYVALLPNGKYILSSSLDGNIRLWDYMNNRIVKTFSGVDGQPIATKFTCGTRFITAHDPTLIVLGLESMGVLVWDLQSRKIAFQFHTNATVFDVDVHEGGKMVAACDGDGNAYLFEMNHGTAIPDA